MHKAEDKAGPKRALPAGTKVGEYEITGFLGAGGMGMVYAGVHPVIGKRVAIKVLGEDMATRHSMVERFVREAKAVVQIDHPSIIDIFAFGEEEGVGHYFVMPLLQGKPLDELLREEGPLSTSRALHLLEQIASALDAAHASKIWHRDLKPANVFVLGSTAETQEVRILDFGIAKLMDGNTSVTQTGMMMGTPLFMSPEQWKGANVDHRTDIYALAVMTFHMVTGEYPFHAESPVALMTKHVTEAPAVPSECGADPRWDAAILRGLAKKASQRQSTASEFVEELRIGRSAPVAYAQTLPDVGSTAEEIAKTFARSRPRALLFAIAMLIPVAVALFFGLKSREENSGTAPEGEVAPKHESAGQSRDPGNSEANIASATDEGDAPSFTQKTEEGPEAVKEPQRGSEELAEDTPNAATKKAAPRPKAKDRKPSASKPPKEEETEQESVVEGKDADKGETSDRDKHPHEKPRKWGQTEAVF